MIYKRNPRKYIVLQKYLFHHCFSRFRGFRGFSYVLIAINKRKSLRKN